MNIQNSKLSTMHTNFGHCGMLQGDVLEAAYQDMGYDSGNQFIPQEIAVDPSNLTLGDEDDIEDVDGIQYEPCISFLSHQGELD